MDDTNIKDDDLELDDEIETSEESPGGESNPEPDEHHDDDVSPETQRRASDDDADYSQRVKKRIDKEVARRKAAEERETRLSAQLAALHADISAMKVRNAAADAQAAEGTLQAKLQSARQRLQQAKLDQDVDAELSARDEYDDLRSQEREFRNQTRLAQQQQERAQPGQLATGTAQWLERNNWYTTGANPQLARMAAMLDESLQEEGYDPNDPEMYVELNRRLKSAVPKSASIIGEMKPAAPRQRDPGPPSGTSSADSTGTPSVKRKLTRDDLARMQQFGLDPNDKEARRAWLVNHP